MGLLSFNRGGQALIYGPAQAQTPYGIPQALAAPDMDDDETSTGKKKSTSDKGKGKESEYLPGYTRDEMKWDMLLKSKQNALVANAMTDIKENYGNRIEAWYSDKGVQYQTAVAELNDEIINYEAAKDSMKQQTKIWEEQMSKVKDMKARNQYVFNPDMTLKRGSDGRPITQEDDLNYAAEHVAKINSGIDPTTKQAVDTIRASQPTYSDPYTAGSFTTFMDNQLAVSKATMKTKYSGTGTPGVQTINDVDYLVVTDSYYKSNIENLNAFTTTIYAELYTNPDAYKEGKDMFIKQWENNQFSDDPKVLEYLGIMQEAKKKQVIENKPNYTDKDFELTEDDMFRGWILARATDRADRVINVDFDSDTSYAKMPDSYYQSQADKEKLTRFQAYSNMNLYLPNNGVSEPIQVEVPIKGDKDRWIPWTKGMKQATRVDAGTTPIEYTSILLEKEGKTMGESDANVNVAYLSDVTNNVIIDGIWVNKKELDKFPRKLIGQESYIYALPLYETDNNGNKTNKPVYATDPLTGEINKDENGNPISASELYFRYKYREPEPWSWLGSDVRSGLGGDTWQNERKEKVDKGELIYDESTKGYYGYAYSPVPTGVKLYGEKGGMTYSAGVYSDVKDLSGDKQSQTQTQTLNELLKIGE